jgi:hypothetical protein
VSFAGGSSAPGAQLSTTLVGASVTAALSQEISHATETWAQAGQYGYCIGPLNGAPANAVRPGQWRCAVAGTVILTWTNATAGNLTPANASAANPYLFICMPY